MKNFSSHDAKNISYILDVKANARGYEQLAIMGLKQLRDLHRGVVTWHEGTLWRVHSG